MTPRRPLPTLLSALALVTCAGLDAQEATSPQKKKSRKEDIPSATVVVSATRTERTEKETAGTVSVIQEKELELRMVQRPTDLVRFEPGVEVGNRPDRQGSTSFSIRGIGGNRVLILVDGVNLPDGPEAGRSYNRDLVDLDSVKRLEVLRGPSSAMYGSDALGGVVTYVTKDARDYLEGKSGLFSSLRGSYTSVNGGTGETFTVAGAKGKWDGLLLGTHRNGHEAQTALGTPNPQSFRSNNVMGKVGFRPSAHHRIELGAQQLERHTETRLLSNEGTQVLGPPPTPVLRILQSNGRDLTRRNQFSLQHVFENDEAYFQRAEWHLFHQESNSLERTDERRDPGSGPRIRMTDYRFRQEILGLRSQAERRFSVGQWAHRLLFGLDGARTETSRPYDRSELNLTTGVLTKTVAGMSYPSKVCPDSTTETLGLFAQGEVVNPAGNFTTILGARFDTYAMDPHPDADFARSNTLGLVVKKVSNTSLSPKLGVLAKFNRTWSAFAQYSRGFRNPPYDNANIAFGIQAGPDRYMVIPNTDLRPERNYGLEGGLRGEGASWDSSFAVFYSRYRDFITDTNLGRDPKTGMVYLQYVNLQQVRIRGLEAKMGCVFWDNYRFQASAAYTEGDDLFLHQPLDSVAPLKAVLGLGYRGEGGRWGLDFFWTGVARKSRVPPPSQSSATGFGSSTMFRSPGYGTADLLAHWNPVSYLRIQAGVFNLTDQTHWRWEDVRGYGATDPVLPRYSQPGRNFSLGCTFSWK